MSSRCGEKGLLFITSSPRTLFYACKTFMLFPINGGFIFYGVSLCLKCMFYFTLNLDIHYLRDYLHLLCTVMGVSYSNATNVSQIWDYSRSQGKGVGGEGR